VIELGGEGAADRDMRQSSAMTESAPAMTPRHHAPKDPQMAEKCTKTCDLSQTDMNAAWLRGWPPPVCGTSRAAQRNLRAQRNISCFK
jgi:hypothetical protein